MSFVGDIERFAAKSRARMNKVASGTTQALAKNMVELTPTNTGKAKGNWLAQLDGQMPIQQTGRNDVTGAETLRHIASVLAALDVRKTKHVWICNTLPYILDLEQGSSDQAPYGMMRLTAMRFHEFVAQAARESSG